MNQLTNDIHLSTCHVLLYVAKQVICLKNLPRTNDRHNIHRYMVPVHCGLQRNVKLPRNVSITLNNFPLLYTSGPRYIHTCIY